MLNALSTNESETFVESETVKIGSIINTGGTVLKWLLPHVAI